MHIAYLVNQYPQVSHSFIRREILALERQGFKITRIALRGWDEPLPDKEDQLERSQTRFVLQDGALALLRAVLLIGLTRPIKLFRALALACRMGRRAERPLPVHVIYLAEACRIVGWLRLTDVQHLHAHFGTNSAEVAMLVHELGGPRWSFTVHGPEEFDKAQFIGLGEKIRRCAFVVAVSSFGRSQLFRCVDHENWNKIAVVHCGLDPKYFVDHADHSSARSLVCVGRLCEQKGQLLLLEAARLLRDRGTAFRLTFAGDGELRATIETLITTYRLEDIVQITGWLSGDGVREQLLVNRALVLPSFAEGLPVVIMEAMALGRPVISTFVAGIPELVYTGKQGWMIPAGDIDALVEAMQTCLDASPETLQRMGNSALESVSRSHNIDLEAKHLAELFCAAVDNRSSQWRNF
jgi:colanic acid/amylovoran biosynthesis glycosyltransferase